MKTFVYRLMGMLAVLFSSQTVEAGFASSVLEISDVRFERQVSPGVWVSATSAEIPFITTSTSSTSSASYTGFTPVSNVADGFYDVARSFLQAAPAAPVSTPNSFISNGQLVNYAVGDTNGSGTLIAVGGVQASTLAEVNALGAQVGSSLGTVATGGAFVPAVTGLYRIALTATGSLTTISSVGSTGEAGVGLGINVNTIGVGGGVMTNLLPPSLNQTISGTTAVSFTSLSVISDSFGLTAGDPYSFNINQSSSASISAVPEPTSIALLSLVGAFGLAAHRFRRKSTSEELS